MTNRQNIPLITPKHTITFLIFKETAQPQQPSAIISQPMKNHIMASFCLLIVIGSFTPEILEIELAITRLQAQNKAQAESRLISLDKVEETEPNLPVYSFQQANLVPLCRFTSKSASSFVFQTVSNVFFAVNSEENSSVNIYDSECTLISTLNNIQVSFILGDRGLIQNGIVYFVTKEQSLFHLYEENKFKNPLKLAVLKDKKIEGGVVRYRGKDRVEIFIGYHDGTIEVYDQSGNSKLRLFLEEYLGGITQMIDHHPYPLMATRSNWISMLDTSKYVEISHNCPHITNVKYIQPESNYGDTVHVITNDKIIVLSLQANKKACGFKKQYSLPVTISHVNKASFYSNCLFFDGKVFNLTEKQLFTRPGCSLESNLEFVSRRNHHDQEFCLRRCCNEDSCTVQFLSVKRTYQDKNIFIWLTVSFAIVIAISLLLMNKSKVSNLDIDEPPGRPAHLSEQTLIDLSKKTRERNKQKKR